VCAAFEKVRGRVMVKGNCHKCEGLSETFLCSDCQTLYRNLHAMYKCFAVS